MIIVNMKLTFQIVDAVLKKNEHNLSSLNSELKKKLHQFNVHLSALLFENKTTYTYEIYVHI